MSFLRVFPHVFAALGSLGCLACSGSHEPGLELRVTSLPVAPESRVLTTDLGYELELESAFWTNAEFGLSACPSALRGAWDLLVPSALAHGTATSTRLATPTVQSALVGEELELGVLAPPANRYCSVTLLIAPADDDARGLEEAPEMLGMAVAVKGSFRAAGSDEAVAFEIASTLPVTVMLELELELDAEHRAARVRVEHSIPGWFDGIDFAALDAVALETSFVANVAAAASVHAE